MKSMTLRQKGFLGLLLWIFVLLGGINTNNDPNPFVTKIFSPIKLGGTTIYYSGLISLVLLYMNLGPWHLKVLAKGDIIYAKVRRGKNETR